MSPHIPLKVGRTILYYSRPPRGGELDGVHYHFRTREEIEALESTHFIVFPVREHLQALDLDDIRTKLEDHDVVFVEIYHTIIDRLNDWAREFQDKFDLLVESIFLLPMGFDEVRMVEGHLGIPPGEFIARLIRGKMKLRGRDGPEEVDRQARDAWEEMQSAPKYKHRIVCPHGEDEVEAWFGKSVEELHPHVQLVLEQFKSIMMSHPGRKRIVVLSGPSCTGKGPLWATFSRLYLH
ncbi:MAG: hypothetical protein ACTSU5_13520 [Promethearchaeota archaeon]